MSTTFLILCYNKFLSPDDVSITNLLRNYTLVVIMNMYSIHLLLACFVLVHSSNHILIANPSSLVNIFPAGVPHRPALFGIPTYGASLTGRVVYATPGDRDGCSPINTSLVDDWPSSNEAYIVMVERGDCSFTTKVKNAQDVGAKAVIIIDNRDEITLPYMADDGTGASIYTPSVLISRKDGGIIIEATSSGTVVVTMEWGVPHPDGIVEWSLWTSSHDENSREFKSTFAEVSAALGEKAVFNAHYYILTGDKYGCTSGKGDACGNQCTNEGRYCAVDPEHDVNVGIDGTSVVKENLRQLCVFQIATKTQNNSLWWDYVNEFGKECDTGTSTDFSVACSTRVLDRLRINKNDVNSCVVNSGGYSSSGGPNTLLDYELRNRTEKGIFLLPTILINDVAYRGSLTCPTPVEPETCGVLSALCDGYAAGTAPPACSANNGCKLGVVRDACGVCGGAGSYDACGVCLPIEHPGRKNTGDICDDIYFTQSGGVSYQKVFEIVVSTCLVAAIILYGLHRRALIGMRKEFSDVMQQYVPLADAGDDFASKLPSIESSSEFGA